MQTTRWTSLLALGMLVVPITGHAQGPEANAPRKLEATTSLGAESAQSGVAGKWYAPASMGPRLTTMEFKVDGTKLTGTVSRYTDSVRIYDGTISGNTISFRYKSPDSFRTISLVGKVGAAEIAFTRTVTVDTAGRVGSGGIFGGAGSPTFTATRALPVFNAPPPELKPTFAGPEPKITEIATIQGVAATEMVRTPNGRFVIYTSDLQSVYSYNLATKQSTPIVSGGFNVMLTVSPRGDRVVFMRIDDVVKMDLGPLWAIAINPTTGLPTATAQRVTLSYGISPVFSPDGKSIAFVQFPKDLMAAETGKDSLAIAVVPASGGAERILTKIGRMAMLSWSEDGKWIYFKDGADKGPEGLLSRVPATGGKTEQVLTYGHPENAKTPIDAQVAFFDVGSSGSGRIGYLTSNGGRGEFKIPVATGRSFLAFGPPEIAFSTTIMNKVNILDIATGKVRELPAEGLNARSVSWSPDQKRLVFASGEGEHQEVVVVNADGTAQRRVPITGGTKLTGNATWTPDGKILTYNANDNREIWALDVATGATRLVTSVAAPNLLYATDVWQADGRSFVTTTSTDLNNRTTVTGIIEVRLDGTKRALRDLTTGIPSILSAFILARQAVVTTGDSPAAGPYGFLLVPFDGGAPRPVPMPALGPGERLNFISGKSEKWLAATRTKGNQATIQLMSTGTDSTRLLPLPANFTPRFPLLFMPDGRHMMTYGYTTGEKDFSVYLVPLDGTAPRVIGHLPPATGSSGIYIRSWSADGKFFAYFAAGTSTTHVYDVDLTPILNLIKKP